MSQPLYRSEYRGFLELECTKSSLAMCEAEARRLIDQGRLMTAALYRYGRQLFLYEEAIGEPLPPEAFMRQLRPYMSTWPQKGEALYWARMAPVFWHQEPIDAEDWRRRTPPLARRGRIAYLQPETMFEYVYHHFALTREGLHRGDRYMFISLHEDVLFSYFEEPRSAVNIRRTDEGESQALQDWLACDPDSHFIHLPGSEGQNFLLLPALFALGQS